jgi:hypothetical protein
MPPRPSSKILRRRQPSSVIPVEPGRVAITRLRDRPLARASAGTPVPVDCRLAAPVGSPSRKTQHFRRGPPRRARRLLPASPTASSDPVGSSIRGRTDAPGAASPRRSQRWFADARAGAPVLDPWSVRLAIPDRCVGQQLVVALTTARPSRPRRKAGPSGHRRVAVRAERRPPPLRLGRRRLLPLGG